MSSILYGDKTKDDLYPIAVIFGHNCNAKGTTTTKMHFMTITITPRRYCNKDAQFAQGYYYSKIRIDKWKKKLQFILWKESTSMALDI